MERLAASLTLSMHHRYKIGPTLLLCHAPPLGTMLLQSLLEQQVNYDEDIPPSDPPNNMQGPMTRVQMYQVNLEVSSFLNDLLIFLILDYYLVMLYFLGALERVMRNLEEEMEAKMTSKDVQHKPEARSNMNSSLPQSPGPVCHKVVSQDASGLCF